MKIITNWHYHALMAIATIAILGIFSDVQADGLQWYLGMVVTKGIGGIAAYVYYRMMRKWLSNGSLPEIEELIKEE